MSAELARLHIGAFVPLEIRDLKKRQPDGPTAEQFERVSALSFQMAEKGDVFQFGGKRGEAAEYMARLVEALAIMAFIPGGVTFLGMHFEEIAEEEAVS